LSTHVHYGKGKLYGAHSNKLISTVSYKIHEEITPDGTIEKWWGEITLTDTARILDGDRYVIELDDQRKGKCFLKRRINRAVVLVPPRYVYLLHGTGALA